MTPEEAIGDLVDFVDDEKQRLRLDLTEAQQVIARQNKVIDQLLRITENVTTPRSERW